MSLSNYKKNRLITMNKILIKGRWVYATGLFLVGLISKITGAPNVNFPTKIMVLLVFSVYVINILYWFFFNYSKHISNTGIKIITFLQLIIDQIFYVVIILYAGGIISISFIYFFFNIIASAFFYQFFGVLIICTIAAFLYGGLIILQFLNILPYFSRYNLPFENLLAHNFSAIITNLSAVIISFYVVGIFAGIIAESLKKKELENLNEKNKIKTIIDNLNDGIIYINHKKNIELINKEAEKLLNLNNFNQKISPRLKKILKNNKKEQTLIGEDNEPSLKIFTIKIKNTSGSNGAIKIIRDISREKFIEKIKYEFINIVTHQLRTPLSGIKGGLSMLLENDFGKLKKEQKMIIEKCYHSNEQIISMINDLFDVYTAEEGKFDYKFSKIDLNNLIKKIIKKTTLSKTYADKKITLKLSENLPKIFADPQKITLALTSLIDNSIKYTLKKGIIEIKTQKKKKKILISIKDNGIGISKEDKKKIFTKFFRTSEAKKIDPEGNGLNLYVTKNIIEKHNGKICLKSIKGRGTTFFIELPL